MLRGWTVIAALLVLAGQSQAEPPDAAAKVTPLMKQEGAAAKPAIFSDKSYSDAVAASKTGGKITVVKATASWCGPCKMMDRTTFVDEKVIKWFGENGMIIEFDVDHDRQLASDLNIRAMPTTIAFKDGKEFDRIVGYRDGAGLLNWLEDVKAGRRAGDDLQVKVEKAKADEGAVSVRERMDLANQLAMSGKVDAATEEYIWLWNNMVKREPSMSGVRGSFLAGQMERLAAQHDAAKAKFGQLRDQAAAALGADGSNAEAFVDWVTLNKVMSEDDKSLAWFDKNKANLKDSPLLARSSFRFEQLFIDNGRIADISLLYPDPMAKLQSDAMVRNMAPALNDAEQSKLVKQIHDNMFRDRTATLYASLLMAGRKDEAKNYAAEALKLDDTPSMRAALVRKCVENKAGQPDHRAWLDEAAKGGESVEDLRGPLEQQAGKP